MTPCPSGDTLRLFLAGEVPNADAGDVGRHIDSCPACQALLDRLGDDDVLRGWLDDTPPQGHTEPALAQLLDGLHASTRLPATSPSARDSAPLSFLGPPRQPGDLGTLGEYRVVRELGRGGMGIVLEAYDEGLNRAVAVKVLRLGRDDDDARARFVYEARAAARVKHDHVVSVHAVFNPPGAAPYLVMEFVTGLTLAAHIHKEHRLAPRRAAEICAEVAAGLGAAHAAGLIHRDVKPGNVLLDESTGRARLTDFGLARAASGRGMTQEGVILGTPAYMSPEQITDPDGLDARTDVYSLGVTLYEALTGAEPFRGATQMVLKQILDDEPAPPRRLNDAVPADLETVCLKAMAKDRERRYAGASDFAEDLRRFLRGEPVDARPVGRAERLWRWCRRNPRVATLSGLVVLLLLVVAVGSSLFAVGLAREQAETEWQRLQAVANAAAAEAQRAKAERHAREAGERRAVALRALDTLVNEVQERLKDTPGTLKLKTELLETALIGLERVVRDEEGSATADRNVVVALRRLGEVQEALGRGADARRSYGRACDLGEKLLAAEPKDDALRAELARAYDQLGLMDFRDLNAAGAAANYKKAIALWLPLAKSHPDTLRNLAIACNRVGDLERQAGRLTRALALHREALAVLDAMPEGGDAALRLSDYRFTHGRVALALADQLQLGAAADQHRRALGYAERLAGLDPANLVWRRDLGFAAAQLAAVCLQLDQVAEARRLTGLYLDSVERLSAADPQDARWRREVALALLRVGEVGLRAGELPEARRRFGAALAAVESLRRQDPFSVQLRIDAAVARTRLADVAARSGRHAEAAAACGEVVSLLAALEAEGQLREPYLRAWLANLRLLGEALAGADLAARDLKFALSAPAGVVAPALGLRALSLARRGRHEEAAATVERLGTLFGGGPDELLTRARVYALCAGAASEGALRRRYVGEAVAALREAVRLAPQGMHRLEPDLEPVRGEPAYRKFLGELRDGEIGR